MQQQSVPKEQARSEIFEYGIDLNKKTLLLFGSIGPEMLLRTTAAIDQMNLTSKDCLTVLLCSEGGSLYDGLGIYDMLRWAQKDTGCTVKIVGIGYVMSMAVTVLQAASVGQRFLMPNCSVMVHLGHETTPAEIHPKERERLVSEFDRIQKLTFTIVSDAMGMTYHKWKRNHTYDTYFDAELAVKLGLADAVIKDVHSGKQRKRKVS